MSDYTDKNEYLNLFSDEIPASEFYRDLFPVGSFEDAIGYHEEYPKTGKGNGFIVYQTEDNSFRTRMVFDDLSEIGKFCCCSTAFMSPISYFGRNRTSANARQLYALTFDLDGVGKIELDNFFGYYVFREVFPKPTYVVNSGGGVHLYYFFEQPVPLYPNLQKALKNLKYALTKKMWNEDTAKIETVQYQGINQGFRIVGGKTKDGERVTAWKTGRRFSLEQLSSFVDEEFRINDTFYHSKLTLEQAKEKYPEWYEQRIVQGRSRKNWTCKRDLYDWWLAKKDLAKLHHRYFFVMSLAVYAVKSGVTEEELKKDVADLVPFFNNEKKFGSSPFTMADADSAVEMYQECYRSFPRAEIEKISGIPIPPNKRNGRTQIKHLQGARAIRDINNENWRKGNGRKSVQKGVFEFLETYPNATARDFRYITGMSERVFYKYKKLFASK